MALNGLISSTSGNAIALQGTPIASTTPTDGQVLKYVAVDGKYEPGSSGSAPTGAAGGDLGGTYPNPTVISVADVTTGVLPAANQAAQSMGGAVGGTTAASTISLTGNASITGVLPAANQASQTMTGDVTGTTGANTVAKVDGVSYPASPSTNTVPVVTSANTVTYQAIANAQVSASAALAVSKLAAGTAGQVLLNNSTPTPAWTTLGTDVSVSSAGVVNLINITGATSVCTVTSGTAINFGTNPSTTGVINLPNATTIKARNAANSQDITMVGTDASNNVSVGAGVNVANVILNASTGNLVKLDINSVDAWTFSNTTLTLPQLTTAYGITQTAQTSDAATNNLTITPQAAFASATGTNRTPGSLIVALGAPTNSGSTEASLQVTRGGTTLLQVNNNPGISAGALAMQLGSNVSNTLSTNGTTVTLQAAGTVNFSPGGLTSYSLSTTAITLSSTTAAYTMSQTAAASTSGASGSNGNNLSITGQAGQAATGASHNGGNGADLVLTAGVGGTSGSATAGLGGSIKLAGGQKVSVISKSATYTVDTNSTTADYVILLTGNAFTTTLPVPTAGRVLKFKDAAANAATQNKTLSHNASETIDGSSTYVINVNNAMVTLLSDGTNWFVMDSYNGTVV